MTDSISEADWDALARNLLRGSLMTRGVSYARLVERLETIGVRETEASIKNKVARGRFPLAFFLQAMAAIGIEWVHVPTVEALVRGEGLGDHGAQQLARRRPGDGPT